MNPLLPWPVAALLIGLALIGLALLRRWAQGRAERAAWPREAGAIGVLLALVAGFFWRPLFTSNVWLPIGGGDLASFFYPLYSFIYRSIQAGQLPLWNPYAQSGMPLAADVQSGLFYPPNLLAWYLLPSYDYGTLEWLLVLHYTWAILGMYLWLRDLRLLRLAAVAGAAAFAFCGFMTAHFGHLPMIFTAAWLPWNLLLARRAATRANPLWVALAGLALGVTFLAGHPQTTLYEGLAVLLYWLFLMWSAERGMRNTVATPLAPSARLGWLPDIFRTPQSALRIGLAVRLGLIGLIAAGLGAVQLLPAQELAGQSFRAAITYEEAAQYAMQPVGLLTLVLPRVFGANPENYWVPWQSTETWGYLGVVVLLLAGVGLVLRRDRRQGFLVALGVLALLAMLGPFSVVFSWIQGLLPGFDRFRAAGRFLLLLGAATAGLAALGLDTLWRLLPVVGSRQSRVESREWVVGSGPQAGGGETAPIGDANEDAAARIGEVANRGRGAAFDGLERQQIGNGGATLPDPVPVAASAGQTAGAPPAVTPAVAVSARPSPAAAPSLPLAEHTAITAEHAPRNAQQAVLDAGTPWDGAPAPGPEDARRLRWLSLGITGLAGFVVLVLLPLTTTMFLASPYIERGQIVLNDLYMLALWLGLVAGLLVAAMRGRLNARAVVVALAVLLVLDLFSPNSHFNPTSTDILSAYEQPAAVDLLRAGTGPPAYYRIDSDTDAAPAWQPLLGTLAGIPDAGGLYNPLQLRRYADCWDVAKAHRNSVLYDLLSVKYTLALSPSLIADPKFARVAGGNGGLLIAENIHADPRLFLVHDAQVEPDDNAALGKLLNGTVLGWHTIYLSDGTATPSNTPSTLEAGNPGEQAQITRYTPNEIEARVTAREPGWAVFSETWYPGWEALIDGGSPVPVQRADVTLRAVRVPAGTHTILLRFNPPRLVAGLQISLGTLLLTVVVGLAAWAAWRREAHAAGTARTGDS